MANIWFIRPGEKAFLWNDCKDKKCIVIGWENEDGFEKFKSREDVKKIYGPIDSNSIWSFYKNIKINDVVVATGSNNTVLGVGIIKSDYLPPNHPDNPELEYKNARMVDWLITEDLKIETKLAVPTVTWKTKNGVKRWNELVRKYIAKNSDYKKILDGIDPPPPEYPPLHEAFAHTKNVILYGPPGTGKTYIAQQFIEEFLKNQGETKPYYEFVTFHQSYGYEDFMEGLKPSVEDGNISYNIEAGVFKEFCDKARNDENNKYLFVIDEINRGNISKIFGELITLIEDDKRNKISAKLPYSKKDFTVPPNVYMLGTMNTADRSIALLDIALRRRFTFLELMPKASLLNYEIDKLNINDLLTELNKEVTKLIDRNHQIGHSYFCKVAAQIKDKDYNSAKEELHFVWYRKIIPLLQEYFYHDWTQLKQVLGNFISNTDNSISEFEIQDEQFMNALKSIANNSTKQNNQGDEIKSGSNNEEGE